MKSNILLCSFLFFSISIFSQVGIGNTNPNAQLDISASNVSAPINTDGVLIPRVSDLTPIASMTANQDGMMVFLNTNITGYLRGFYYWDNSQSDWIPVTGAKKIDDLLDGRTSPNNTSMYLGTDAGINGGGNENVGLGYKALEFNTVGFRNVAVGYLALRNNTDADNNVAIGSRAMFENTTGNDNTAVGHESLDRNNTGHSNTAIGRTALSDNTTGFNNTGIGKGSLNGNVTGSNNTATGNYSLAANTIGSSNTAFGYWALRFNTGSNNTAVGKDAMWSNTSGILNSVLGARALYKNTSGNYNVALGYDSGGQLNGNSNVLIGYGAGSANNTFTPYANSGNIMIGFRAGYGQVVSNRLFIENSQSSLPLIYGEFDNNILRFNGNVGIGRSPVTNTLEVEGEASKTIAGAFVGNSDSRLKKNIMTIEGKWALSIINKMRGVSYKWNDTKTGTKRPTSIQYGFIAQELMEIFPEKVSKDNLGYYQTAYGDYDAVFVQAIKELDKKVEDLKAENQKLNEQLKKYQNLEDRLLSLEKKNKDAIFLANSSKN